jgi:hypothetical protein
MGWRASRYDLSLRTVDPRARPGTSPVELGRHDRSVRAVAVLADGRVVSGGDDRRVLIWNTTTKGQAAQLDCSVIKLEAVQVGRAETSILVVHEGQGFSLWSLKRDDNEP